MVSVDLIETVCRRQKTDVPSIDFNSKFLDTSIKVLELNPILYQR